jgi:predicted small metal-binding protein
VSRLRRQKEPKMPKHLECIIPDCDFAVTSATEEEILRQVALHAEHAHGVTRIPAELEAQVKAAIEDQTKVK